MIGKIEFNENIINNKRKKKDIIKRGFLSRKPLSFFT